MCVLVRDAVVVDRDVAPLVESRRRLPRARAGRCWGPSRSPARHGSTARSDRRRIGRSRRPSSSSRSIDSARAPLSSLTPRWRKSSSSTPATSGSLPGSTCWRLTTRVTCGAERREHVDELDAGDTRADHRDALREHLGRVAIAGRQDPVAVGRRTSRGSVDGTRSPSSAVSNSIVLVPVGAGRLGGVRAGETGGAVDHLDALAAEQLRDVVVEIVLDVLTRVGQGLDVDLGDRLGEAHPAQPAREAHRATGGDHRLRRDAVPQVRRTAEHVAFDDGHLGAEPSRVGRGLVPGRSATDDQESHAHAAQATGSARGRCPSRPHLRRADGRARLESEGRIRAPTGRVPSGTATHVRAVVGGIRDLIARFADPLEVHAVGRRKFPPHAKP